jgi:excisionase family DNA binding protein
LPDKPLLSISEASQLLGVSEGSLRQWTDDGLIKAFVTPGGHRRYNQADLNRFRKTHPRMLGLKDLVAELKESTPKHREAGRIPFKDKKHVLNEESQELFAHLGRQMLDLIIKYITEPNSREGTIELIRSVGRQHGEILFKKGLSLTDSIEAFILHRDPIMSSVTRLTEKSEIITGRIVEKIPMVARLMDEALVALVGTYQKYRNKT